MLFLCLWVIHPPNQNGSGVAQLYITRQGGKTLTHQISSWGNNPKCIILRNAAEGNLQLFCTRKSSLPFTHIREVTWPRINLPNIILQMRLCQTHKVCSLFKIIRAIRNNKHLLIESDKYCNLRFYCRPLTKNTAVLWCSSLTPQTAALMIRW